MLRGEIKLEFYETLFPFLTQIKYCLLIAGYKDMCGNVQVHTSTCHTHKTNKYKQDHDDQTFFLSQIFEQTLRYNTNLALFL